MASVIQLIVTLLTTYGFIMSDAHGRLLEPASRMSAYLLGYPTPVNYNDHDMDCGGTVVLRQNGGKCGICGDPWPGPRNYERPNGIMVQHNVITANYTQGTVIHALLQITVGHRGFHEFRICDLETSGGVEATHECLNRNKLADVNGVDRFTNGTDKLGVYDFLLALPKGLTCRHCLFQWKWTNGETLTYSGKEKSGQSGVGILLTKRVSSALLGYNPVSDRILMIRLKTKKRNITVIQIYASTDEEIETHSHICTTICSFEPYGNRWGCNPPPNSTCCMGCGNEQDEYYGCADITINPTSGLE